VTDATSYPLGAPSTLPQVGPEFGHPVTDGIAVFRSLHDSWRYVMHEHGRAIAALQVVQVEPERGVVAGVYTSPAHRRQGHARALLQRAKTDFDTIEAALHLTDDGCAWAAAVAAAQPWRHGTLGGC